MPTCIGHIISTGYFTPTLNELAHHLLPPSVPSSYQDNKDQRQAAPNLSRSSEAVSSSKKTIKVNIQDIVSISPCADLTLPPGAGLCIETINGSFYFVSIYGFGFSFLASISLGILIYVQKQLRAGS